MRYSPAEKPQQSNAPTKRCAASSSASRLTAASRERKNKKPCTPQKPPPQRGHALKPGQLRVHTHHRKCVHVGRHAFVLRQNIAGPWTSVGSLPMVAPSTPKPAPASASVASRRDARCRPAGSRPARRCPALEIKSTGPRRAGAPPTARTQRRSRVFALNSARRRGFAPPRERVPHPHGKPEPQPHPGKGRAEFRPEGSEPRENRDGDGTRRSTPSRKRTP